jgi:TonB family protein
MGAVAYELLTGRAPFPGKTITEVVSRVVHGSHVPPREVDDRLPAELDAVFVRVFATRADDRYERATDFARDLRAAAEPVLGLEVLAASGELPITDPMGTPPTVLTVPGHETAFLGGHGLVRQGVLLLDSDPAGARAYVDDTLVGATPISTVETTFGRHVIRMELQGCVPGCVEVEVGPSRPLLGVSLSLPPIRPPGALRPGQFVDFGPEVAPPRRISGAAPAYPERANERLITGTPVVDLWIGEKGDVVDVALVESAGPALDEALIAAVTTWRFKPATLRGVPVSVRLTVRHEFRR